VLVLLGLAEVGELLPAIRGPFALVEGLLAQGDRCLAQGHRLRPALSVFEFRLTGALELARLLAQAQSRLAGADGLVPDASLALTAFEVDLALVQP
jgi:hypothetical protein